MIGSTRASEALVEVLGQQVERRRARLHVGDRPGRVGGVDGRGDQRVDLREVGVDRLPSPGVGVVVGHGEVDLHDRGRSSRGHELGVDRVRNRERFRSEGRGLDRRIGPDEGRRGIREPVGERGPDEAEEARGKPGSVGDPFRNESLRQLGLAGQERRVLAVDAGDPRDVGERTIARDGGAHVQDDALRVRVRQVRAVEQERARGAALAAREETRELGVGLRARGVRGRARGGVRGHRAEERQERDRDHEQHDPEDDRIPRMANDPPSEGGERPSLGFLPILGEEFHRRAGKGRRNNPIRRGRVVGGFSGARAFATRPGIGPGRRTRASDRPPSRASPGRPRRSRGARLRSR